MHPGQTQSHPADVPGVVKAFRIIHSGRKGIRMCFATELSSVRPDNLEKERITGQLVAIPQTATRSFAMHPLLHTKDNTGGLCFPLARRQHRILS